MRRPLFLARQAGRPTGLLGRALAWVMARETASINERALQLLDPAPDHHVLEIGFGHGRTLARAAALVPTGFVAGVDVSDDMTRLATRRHRRLIDAGRLAVQRADSARLPYPAQRFDGVYAVHTLYFWADPQQHFHEIFRVLKPEGRCVLAFRPQDDVRAVADFPAAVYQFYTVDEVSRMFEQAGFVDVQMLHTQTAASTVVFGVARRGRP